MADLLISAAIYLIMIGVCLIVFALYLMATGVIQ